MADPHWLPAIFPMDGIWENQIMSLFQIFNRDFIQSSPLFEKSKISYDDRVLDGIYPEGFWHVTTRGKFPNRLPDFRRAERLPWCSPSIQNSDDLAIKKWKYIEGGGKGTRIYIWLEKYDYVVILQPRNAGIVIIYHLITAYYVDGPRTKNDLQRKYNQRLI